MINPKMFIVGVLALIIAAIGTVQVHADPYDGVNRIGTYYQQTRTWQTPVMYSAPQAYDYIAPPRAGGWYGSTTGWLVGLRSPVSTPVAPVHYTNYYQQVYGYPTWFGGGYGYPRAVATDFPTYSTRIGGVFSY